MKPTLTLLTALPIATLSWSAAAASLDLIRDSRPAAAIVIPVDADPAQKYAADQLRSYLAKATGAKLAIATEDAAPAEGTLIFVGQTKAAREAGVTTDALKHDGCRMTVKNGRLFLLGVDARVPNGEESAKFSPTDGRAHGTIRAVTKFLEDVVGVRWYLPSPEGEFIPEVKTVSVPDTLDVSFSPDLSMCNTVFLEGSKMAQWANNERRGVMRQREYGGHSWPVHVPAEKYFAAHPEYFAMNERGERDPTKYGHVCTSHPDVRRIMLEEMRKTFDAGYDCVQLGQSDSWKACLCPECQKRYGDGRLPASDEHPGERVWDLHAWLCEELHKSHPDKFVRLMLYGPTKFPSRRVQKLSPNVIAEFATVDPADASWRGVFRQGVVYDYVFVGNTKPSTFIPAVSPAWLKERARRFHAHGVIGIYQGSRTAACRVLGGPSYYAFAKLAGDADFDVDRMLTDYCTTVYAEAAPQMEQFFQLFHSRSGMTLENSGGHPMRIDRLRFSEGYLVEDTLCALYPPAVIQRMDKLLTRGEATAKSLRAKGWLRTLHDEFDGLKTLAEMLAAKRAFELHRTKETLLAVKEKVEAFEAWRMRIVNLSKDPDHIARWFPGHNLLCVDLLSRGDATTWSRLYYGRTQILPLELAAIVKGERSVRGEGLGSSLGDRQVIEPLNWNFDEKLARLGQPEEEPQIVVRRTAAKPGPASADDDPVWKNAPLASLPRFKGIDGLRDKTAVQAIYDDEALHVRFVCREPSIAMMKLDPVPRDGNVYSLDGVDVFLFPGRSSRRFMQFSAAPVEGALFDARKGYIEDTADPRYDQKDVEWNAGWTTTFALDRDKQRWTLVMTIPFASLGVKPPAAGDTWTGNFTRVRRAEGGTQLFSWIPDAFSDPKFFGEWLFADEKGQGNGK